MASPTTKAAAKKDMTQVARALLIEERGPMEKPKVRYIPRARKVRQPGKRSGAASFSTAAKRLLFSFRNGGLKAS